MKPLQYYPKPERPQDPTPLEMAIYNYELKAKSYYDRQANEDSICMEKMNRDYIHLQSEMKRIESLCAAQEALAAYRSSNESKIPDELRKEPHHPTTKLAKFLTAVGEPKPTVNHEAHHIICGVGRFLKARMALARLNLHNHGMGINDPLNGVWLCNTEKNKKDDGATPDSVPHRRIHRKNYETWITSSFHKHFNKI